MVLQIKFLRVKLMSYMNPYIIATPQEETQCVSWFR